ISYNIKVAETETETSEEKTASDEYVGDTAPPSPFREKDPGPGGTGEYGDDEGYSYDLELLPLYRDGAYLVARFRLTNTSDKDIRIPTISGPYFSGNGLPGARFGAFGVVDPETETVYRAVRIGDDDPDETRDVVEPLHFPYEQKPGTTNRSFLYFPAPPLDVEKVTFDAGPFGTFEDVPIEPVPGGRGAPGAPPARPSRDDRGATASKGGGAVIAPGRSEVPLDPAVQHRRQDRGGRQLLRGAGQRIG